MEKCKRVGLIMLIAAMAGMLLMGCSTKKNDTVKDADAKQEMPAKEEKEDQTDEKEAVTILVAAAASLEHSYKEELIPMFEREHPHISVEGTYDSSGKLQTQIEEGLDADVFMSAATKQMNALVDESMVDKDSVIDLLKNKIVLITSVDSALDLKEFTDITKADTIAIGDPESVPAGQYSKEALENLGLWEDVLEKASMGTNVTEVLNWVAEGSAEAGIVYATDAAATDKVKVIAQAPEGSLLEDAVYPVGVISGSSRKEAARLFVDFLQSEEATAVFEKYGFEK